MSRSGMRGGILVDLCSWMFVLRARSGVVCDLKKQHLLLSSCRILNYLLSRNLIV
ncbi:hypothetical protein M758_2G110800 [Ceratodon purpureus]|uniref:Uncharacterized protein n=1 Tax=Ceratodon purpureus TaxID=3225 RepID=A0A8T0IT92_CERPU|nr:hypothetical protein KC19_2G128400 [Ceratodon purpureus]KAG0626206.1 hypothetical protein M758_2G110800 [Ceratodon purpureus]